MLQNISESDFFFKVDSKHNKYTLKKFILWMKTGKFHSISIFHPFYFSYHFRFVFCFVYFLNKNFIIYTFYIVLTSKKIVMIKNYLIYKINKFCIKF